MLLTAIPFATIEWSRIEKEIHAGETGFADWRIFQLPGLRVRMVVYSAGYSADHWCTKGHIVYCIEGEFVSEMTNGESYTLTREMSYIVSDNASSHRSHSKDGATLLIIDGDFLKLSQ